MGTYAIDINEDVKIILIQIADEFAANALLSDNEKLELAIDILANSYDSSLTVAATEDAVHATPDDLHNGLVINNSMRLDMQDAINKVLDTNISTNETEITTPQKRLF